jgi:hypothetical protein
MFGLKGKIMTGEQESVRNEAIVTYFMVQSHYSLEVAEGNNKLPLAPSPISE